MDAHKELPSVENVPLDRLLACFGMIVIVAGLCRTLELGNAGQFLISGIRAFVQLRCLGFILHPIIASDSAGIVFAYIFVFMIFVSAYEAAARPEVTYPGIFRDAVCSFVLPLFIFGALLLATVTPTPWYNARYVVPLGGVLIGGALYQVALVLNLMLEYLTTNKVQLEALLAFGASPWEAAWPGFVKSAEAALMPAINGMNVIGLVSIPGTMTGMIFQGASPTQAAKYQIVVTLVPVGYNFMSLGLICAFAIRAFFDARGRYDALRVTKQPRLTTSQCLHPSCFWWGPSATAGASAHKEPLLAPEQQEVSRTPLALVADTDQRDEAAGQGEVVLRVDLHGRVAGVRPLHARLDLRTRETACIMGPSGVGKTTLLKWVSDLAAPVSAAMALRGRSGKAVSPQSWRRDVLYVEQSKAPLPGTPLDFVQTIQRLGVNRGRTKFDPAPHMRAVGLSELMLERPWSELSGGEAQRAMLSIVLSTSPACVLLDEPTTALDDASKVLVEEHLRAVDTCVLLVTHDEAQAARVATSVWRIEEQ